ncbi:MAG: S6e family ribosomal protein [Nanoarchaeota archaeon]
MLFKINISDKSGKTYKLESDSEDLIEKELHNKIHGKILSPDLEGYEFEITGASDSSGFTSHKDVPGISLKRMLLTYGKAMHKRPRREGKKKISNPKPDGLRLRKTVRGRVISQDTVQINLKVLKEGHKKLNEIFPDQGKGKEKKENRTARRKKPKEKPKAEEKTE